VTSRAQQQRVESFSPKQAGSTPLDFAGRAVHLIGVGGCGMRALAAALMDQHAKVSGSDINPSATIDLLNQKGATCWTGHDPARIQPDVSVVVVSAAIREDNPELREARRRGVTVLKYAQMLGMLMAQRTGLAIAGTHGKSTTTAMLAYTLKQQGLDPSFIIGAHVDQLGGASAVGTGRFFVAEACEYDRSFLNLSPACAAILNVEEDHLDYYKDMDAIVDAFARFASRVDPAGLLVVNGDESRCLQACSAAPATVETFSLSGPADWQATEMQLDAGRYRFTLLHHGEAICRVHLALPGRHNVANALAAGALAHHCGVQADTIARSLSDFRGAHRRMTLKAILDNVTILDDYAHHPTEIRATLQAVRQCYQPRRLWCIFQPHQHSRTRFLLEDFAASFAGADRVVVPDIYFVRDSHDERQAVNSGDLVARIAELGGTACYLPRFDQILQYVKSQLVGGDLVITMGAGDVWRISDELVQWLGTHPL